MSDKLKRNLARALLTLVFVGAGVGHFVYSERFLSIVPPYLPAPEALNYVSGVFEILGGIGVWAPWANVRKWAGYGLVALLVSVYIVNIDMALHGSPLRGGEIVPEWLLWARLPMQFVLMWLAIYGTQATAAGERDSGERRRPTLGDGSLAE